jgi:hypothetical protein
MKSALARRIAQIAVLLVVVGLYVVVVTRGHPAEWLVR